MPVMFSPSEILIYHQPHGLGWVFSRVWRRGTSPWLEPQTNVMKDQHILCYRGCAFESFCCFGSRAGNFRSLTRPALILLPLILAAHVLHAAPEISPQPRRQKVRIHDPQLAQ